MNTKLYRMDTDFLNDKFKFDYLYQTLPGFRKEKVDKMKFQKDKNLSLGVWILLRKAFEKNGISIKDCEVKYLENGKPYFENLPYYFNLSHSGTVAICSISENETGCDVEKIRDKNFKIADRYFSQGEIDFIKSSDDKTDSFFRLWTLKESFMKVTGLGMKLSLNDFSFDLSDGIKLSVNPFDDEFYFKEFDLGDGYKYACCSMKDDIESEMFFI